jgi:pSer/pThr/pTyr-binding forkhead associated (FHA) protein
MSELDIVLRGKLPGLPKGKRIGLRIIEGNDQDHEFVLSKKYQVTFGRSGTDVELLDPGVSKQHCSLEVYNDLIVLKDKGSATGTFLNGFLVKEALLKDKDRFKIGRTVFEVTVKDK